MSLLQITGEDSWLKEYEYAGSLISEINQATVRRRQLRLGNLEHSSLSSQLRKLIPQAELQLATLLNSLQDPSSAVFKSIALGEKERRQRLCENLHSALKKASEEFEKGLPRQGPFTKVANLGTVNWGEDETDETRTFTTAELRQQHRSIVEAQDAALENLSVTVGSQRRIAIAIHDEVDDQDDLLTDIKGRVGDTQINLEQQTSSVSEATRKASTWGYWLVIILLLVAIIIVAVW